MIDGGHANGFRVLLSVIGEPGRIASNPGGYYQEFANFVAGLARGGADAIEVWNEMNIDREWPSGLISGANYTQMLSAAYHAIKSANPGTMVISGAPAPNRLLPGLFFKRWRRRLLYAPNGGVRRRKRARLRGHSLQRWHCPARCIKRRACRQFWPLFLVPATHDEPVPQLLPVQATLLY